MCAILKKCPCIIQLVGKTAHFIFTDRKRRTTVVHGFSTMMTQNPVRIKHELNVHCFALSIELYKAEVVLLCRQCLPFKVMYDLQSFIRKNPFPL